jgi:predicted TIM-barrel fold metal-dependent hydrolase
MPNDERVSVSVQQFFEGKKGIKKLPSQYFYQFYNACLSWESYLTDTINGWPNHNIIIGSDFDHGDAVATWPRTVDVIKRMKDVSEVDKEKVLGGNAMRMFGLNGNGAVKHGNASTNLG